jgi:rhodanese-related sulfurtransferase
MTILRTTCATLIITFLSITSANAEDAIDAEQLLKYREKLLIVDVRTPAEYQTGHIPGAILMPLETLASSPSTLKRLKNKSVVVYCRTGRRAGIAINWLKQQGLSQVKHLKGDMIQWIADKRPTHKGVMP